MQHTDPANSYPLSYYDAQMCLKPPVLLWVAVLYLSRAITLPLAAALGHFAGVDARAVAAIHALWSINALLPSVIAVVVLYTFCRRVPTASMATRWIWRHGRLLLALSACLDIAASLIPVIQRGEFDDQALLSGFAALVDLYFLFYVLAVRRVRDAFVEFPPSTVADSN